MSARVSHPACHTTGRCQYDRVNCSIQDIWNRVLEGDPLAWEQLVNRYGALVLTVARRVGLSRIDAEDCSQHTWTVLYANRARIRDPLALPAWLIRTTKRQAVHLIKARSSRTSAMASAPERDPVALPDEHLLKLEQQARLEYALKQLEPRCRKLLEALFFAPATRSYREIAEELGLPLNSLGPTRQRCLQKLRAILRELGYL